MWEYMNFYIGSKSAHDEEFIQLMNDYGAQGWELVTVDNGYLFFKRPFVATMPVNVDVPLVMGEGIVGETLTCTMGNWAGTPTDYAYQWRSDDTMALGEGDSYVVAATDVGHKITCIVTASNSAGSTEAPPSNEIQVALRG
jgi:hypothetical protein